MEPNIIELSEKLFVGIRIQTSLAANETLALWQRFKPLVKAIPHRANPDFYSVEIYDKTLDFITHFSPTTRFEKWAAVEVTQVENIPEKMESLVIPGGLYAVFVHHGPAHTYPQTARNFFGSWLPDSAYQLDDRPHFEVMTPQYQPNDPNAQEAIWVPVKTRL